jgi:hypothetical protein
LGEEWTVKKLLEVTTLAVFGIGLSACNKESQEDYVVAKISGEKNYGS